MAKIDRVRNNFAAMHTKLCCPICGNILNLNANSFVCELGHCFDLAAANYLNLAPGKPQGTLYDDKLFATRRRVFEGGFYDSPVQKIADLVADCPTPQARPLTIIDAGCGEGFFARRLQDSFPKAEILALDLAKAGVVAAAKARNELKCLLADLAAIPVADNSADVILNILSPANYREFARVLAPGGLLIKVIPSDEYLREVRAAYGLAPAEESDAARLFAEAAGSAQTAEHRIKTTLPLSPAMAADFLQMTPLSDHRETPKADFHEITIDLRILTAKY